MNSKTILVIAAAGAAISLCAGVPAPQVSGVSMSQNAKGEATIEYTLSATNAVITLDIQTNATGGAWVSIGGKAVSGAYGDVWKVVATGSHRIKWDATTNWADHQIPASGIRAVVTAWALDNTPDYMVVDVSDAAEADTQKYYPSVDFLPGGLLGNSDYRTTSLVMRKIMAKGIEWTSGSTTLETQRNAQREATYKVTLTNNYYIGVFPVTQAQWALIQPSRAAPSYFNNVADRAMRPVENVSYNEIRNAANSTTANTAYDWPADPNPSSFLGKLRTKTGIDFDLPSEAQWVFAARAGNGDTRWGDGSSILNSDADANLDKMGRYSRNGGQVLTGSSYVNPDQSCGATNGTAIVGSYAPNDWGLYDTAGNVWEWCLDWFEANISAYGGKVNIDPAAPSNTLSGVSCEYRVAIGGGWNNTAGYNRPAFRNNGPATARASNYGLRLSCSAGLR